MEDKLVIKISLNSESINSSFKYFPDVSNVQINSTFTNEQKFCQYKKAIEENDELFKNLKSSTFNTFINKNSGCSRVTITWYLNKTKMESRDINFDITDDDPDYVTINH